MERSAIEEPTERGILGVAAASIIGSVIEQYDFLVSGVIAATVWGGVFFPNSGASGAAEAISIYGLGIIIRPVGAYIFGDLADRFGRRNTLVAALVLMGVSTLLIGLTPPYSTIGIIAPILLLIFRLLQGISFGAEFGTASTWVTEHAAHSRHRAFWGAWVGFAIPIGLIAGFGSVLIVKSFVSPEDYIAWGWRVFFFFGFLVAVIGIVIRLKTPDSFVFDEYKEERKVLAHPAFSVWKEMPLKILRTSLVNAMFGAVFFGSFVFGTSYMKSVGITPITAEIVGLVASATMFLFMIFGAWLSDRTGRRITLYVAIITAFVFGIPYFYLLQTGNLALLLIADIVLFGFVFGFGYGAIPAFYTESFPTRYRASGASAGYQISQVYGGGLVPIIAGMLLSRFGADRTRLYVGALIMLYAVLAFLSVTFSRETRGISLQHDDDPHPNGGDAAR